MKQIRALPLLALASALAFQSCDKVDPPFNENLNASSSSYYGYIELQGIPGTVSNLQFRDNFRTDSAALEATWAVNGTSGTVTFRWHSATAQLTGSGPAGGPVSFSGNVVLAEGGLTGTLSFDYTAEIANNGSDQGIVVGYVYQNVLVEDYTGHKCGNCPRAQRKAREFKNFYGDRFILVSIHAGFWASVSPSGAYSYDFRTAAGTAFDTDFGISNAGNPNGMVNRKPVNGNVIVAYTAWGSEANNIFQAKGVNPDACIRIDNAYDAGTRNLDITVRTAVLKDLSGAIKLGVYLLEDSIVNWQKDYDVTPEDVEFYVHRDVFRGDVNGIYGEAVVAPPASSETLITKSYSLAVDPAYDENHCSVLAVLFYDATKEIIQVNESRIIE